MFFLYRPLWIEGLGGVLPARNKLPKTVKLGLCANEDFYLGECEKIEDIWPIRPWVEQILSDDEAKGFMLLNTDEIIEEGIDLTESKRRPLTLEERSLKKKASDMLSSLRSQPLHRERLEKLESRLKAVELSVNSVDTQKES